MRYLALVLVLLLATGARAFSRASAIPTRGGPLVVLSLDGLRPDYLLEADRYGAKIPHLRRMLSGGTYASGVRGVLPTVTYPSHTTLVTGVAPARHGIFANAPFDPTGKNLNGWYWYAEDIRVPTLWDAAAERHLTTANVAWPVTVGAHITYNVPQFWHTSTREDDKLMRALSSPGLLEQAEQALGAFPPGDAADVEADRQRAALCSYLLATHKPDLTLCYLTALDDVQHHYGPGSPETLQTLEALDGLVARVWAAAESASDGAATLALVSDHGFAKTRHELNLNSAFRQAGLISLDARGGVASWRAFAWSNGGSAGVYLNPPDDSDVRRRTEAVLSKLAAQPGAGIERILSEAEAQADGGLPAAAFVVAARPDTHLGTSLFDPVLGPGGGGAHGLLESHHEMDATFVVTGPGIAAGRDIGRIDMCDVAPTLAALVGVPLPSADGRDLGLR